MDIVFKKKKPSSSSSSCWKGYIAVGMKKKGDRYVPNCVLKTNKNKNIKQRRNNKTRKYRK